MTAAGTERPTVHMIGNAHIDPVWLWPLQEGRDEVLSTYRTAISLIREVDGYVFTSGGSVTYQWVAEDDPALFAEIQEAVATGRWALVNGWWLQPDCNIPGGESFLRHALYGQAYLERAFGRRATVGYNVDSFGHTNTLPQLLRQGGLDSYVFFRPGPHEKDLPRGPFWWESPDGSRVLACRPPLHYCSPEDQQVMERVLGAASEAPEGFPQVLCFYGVGNHGGGPTRRNVRAIIDMAENSDARPIFSTVEAFVRAAVSERADWPVIADELQHHSRGCYTAVSRSKRDNRYAEHAMMGAERWAALAAILAQSPYSAEKMAAGWHNVLLNQFHDILAGTSLRDAYDDVWAAYAETEEIAAATRETALSALSGLVTIPEREGVPVMVWNPLAWQRTDAVRFRLPMGDWRLDFEGVRYPGRPIITNAKGQRVDGQIVDVELDYNTYMVHIEALVTVPGLGHELLWVQIPEQDPPSAEPVAPQASTIANDTLQASFDPETGWLISLFDRRQGLEMLASPGCVPLVIDDPSDTWSHGVDSFRDVIGQFRAVEPPKMIASGPASETLRVVSEWGSSRIVQDYTLVAGADRLDLAMEIDWHEQCKMLKLSCPLALADVRVVSSAAYGSIEREPNGEEEPCQGWVDVSGQHDGVSAGLCLLNDSKYGYDVLQGDLRLSLLRSPIYAFHQPRRVMPGVTYHYTDQGKQSVHCQLVPHGGTARGSGFWRRSYALQEPLKARVMQAQPGKGLASSLLTVEPDNVTVSVVKLSENGGRLIARGFETAGVAADVVLHSEALGRSWSVSVGPASGVDAVSTAGRQRSGVAERPGGTAGVTLPRRNLECCSGVSLDGALSHTRTERTGSRMSFQSIIYAFLGSLALVLCFVTLNRYITFRERVALARLGYSLEDQLSHAAYRRGNRGVLWGGVITAMSGMALLLGLATLGVGAWLIAGLLPLFVGLGMLVVYFLTLGPGEPNRAADEPSDVDSSANGGDDIWLAEEEASNTTSSPESDGEG